MKSYTLNESNFRMSFLSSLVFEHTSQPQVAVFASRKLINGGECFAGEYSQYLALMMVSLSSSHSPLIRVYYSYSKLWAQNLSAVIWNTQQPVFINSNIVLSSIIPTNRGFYDKTQLLRPRALSLIDFFVTCHWQNKAAGGIPISLDPPESKARKAWVSLPLYLNKKGNGGRSRNMIRNPKSELFCHVFSICPMGNSDTGDILSSGNNEGLPVMTGKAAPFFLQSQ